MIVALIIAASLALAVAMAIAWLVQWRTHNAGWADVVWTFSLGVAGGVYALFPVDAGAPTARQYLVAAVAAVWSLRLGLHIAGRTRRGAEDARYAHFRSEWGATFQQTLFWFLQIQAAAAALLALSMLLAARNPAPLSSLDAVACSVALIAIAGEAIADRQLRQFRADPAHRDDVCNVGIWGWSRHPNYFFEWLGWVAYPLFAIDPSGEYNWGWLAISAPLFMYGLLVHLSGIPPLEQHMLRSRGATFQKYQAHVSAFFPIPPRWRS